MLSDTSTSRCSPSLALPLLQPPSMEYITNKFDRRESPNSRDQVKGQEEMEEVDVEMEERRGSDDGPISVASGTANATGTIENQENYYNGCYNGYSSSYSSSLSAWYTNSYLKNYLPPGATVNPISEGQVFGVGQLMHQKPFFDINRNSIGTGGSSKTIIQVECGRNIGYMNLGKLCQGSKGSCILYNGMQLTPNEFQFISGRETAKDWKRSIRHNGKSLKLLIKRKLLSVHSSACECFLTNKVTLLEETGSNDEEQSASPTGSESGKSSPADPGRMSSLAAVTASPYDQMKTSLELTATENGQDEDKPTININNNSSGLNLNEKPSKRRRKDVERDMIKVERSSPSESVQSDSEAKRSPPPAMPRNYSDFMRSLAAKYNNQAPVEPTIPQSAAAAAALFSRSQQLAAAGFQKQPLIDMSSATALLQLVRSADLKKYHQSPLDLTSSGGGSLPSAVTPPSSSVLQPNLLLSGGGDTRSAALNSTSRTLNNKDCCNTGEVTAVLGWSVDEVCRFVASIDLCKEYVDAFRSQSIDGSGIPLLTEEHLIAMGMKLGPALKFLSVLKRKLGNCIICQHCPHCHNSSNSNNSNGVNGNNERNGINLSSTN